LIASDPAPERCGAGLAQRPKVARGLDPLRGARGGSASAAPREYAAEAAATA